MKRNFNKTETILLSEIYRRINFFDIDLDSNLIILSYPNEILTLKKLGIVSCHGKEISRCNNWYKLTEIGKKFFSNYLLETKLSERENYLFFNGEKKVNFDYKLFQKLIDNEKE